jgi:hypothetical protein
MTPFIVATEEPPGSAGKLRPAFPDSLNSNHTLLQLINSGRAVITTPDSPCTGMLPRQCLQSKGEPS